MKYILIILSLIVIGCGEAPPCQSPINGSWSNSSDTLMIDSSCQGYDALCGPFKYHFVGYTFVDIEFDSHPATCPLTQSDSCNYLAGTSELYLDCGSIQIKYTKN